ncbi:MAG: hypothetical protein AAF266_02115 [Planctomycetota bacterium]
MRTLCALSTLIFSTVGTLAAGSTVLFESAPLENVGTALGEVNSATVSQFVYTGVRFELTDPVITSAIGGHFVGDGEFFGALVELDDADDVPDSTDLTTDDVLGVVAAEFPSPSAEVLADLSIRLSPDWYAIAFGSGLFGVGGNGGMPVSSVGVAPGSFITTRPQASTWNQRANDAPVQRIVLMGTVVPEPSSFVVTTICCCLAGAGRLND